ncbi:MAG: histidine kinase [Syntrophobacteraceae bacterium]|nr:histidine kinase [Syntrophobacteraceae bacterium]
MKGHSDSGRRDQNAEIGSAWDELRKRAEAALNKDALPGAGWTESDVLGLIHELEVHQTELEMQGEELRLKNEQLKELFHNYAELYHSAPVGYLNLNPKRVIVEANKEACDLLGLPKETLKRMVFSNCVYHEDRSKYFDLLAGANRTPAVKAKAELRLVRSSSPTFFAHIAIVPLWDAQVGLKGWLIAFVDISKRKAAEDALREAVDRLKAMSSRLLGAQEEERKKIARDLHDSFGQNLAAVKFGIENVLVNTGAELSGDAARLLGMLIPTIQMAIEEVRNIYTGLRPSVLDDMGIIAALGWLSRKTRVAFPDLRIESVAKIEEIDVPEELKITLFRIAQEALTNIEKHSEAHRVDITLVKSCGEIELVIEDNGKGFDRKKTFPGDNSNGMGLVNMMERAELSGGTLSVTSKKGRGTRVEARWNLNR